MKYEKVSRGHEKVSGEYEKVSGGHEKVSGEYEKVAMKYPPLARICNPCVKQQETDTMARVTNPRRRRWREIIYKINRICRINRIVNYASIGKKSAGF
jgi:hypothetical protein